MNLEELKVVWDSQNQEPLYAVNEASLHTLVRRRKEAEHRRTAWCYGRDIVINSLCGVAMIAVAGMLLWSDPDWLASLSWINVAVSPWHAVASALAGGIWIYCASYLWVARRRQLHREESMATSLRGDLDRALAHVAFQIDISRNVAWWGLLPSWFAAGLGVLLIFHLKAAPAWAYGIMAVIMPVAFGFALACHHYLIRLRYRPRLEELESLRAKLTNPEL